MPPAPIPDAPPTRADMAAFKATAKAMDEGVGLALKALKANGLAENTLVIYTTDHGLPFPDMKCQLTDHGVGVALIMRGPSGFSGGKVCDAMVSHIDLFPTICDMLRIESPSRLQGKSMMFLIHSDVKEINEGSLRKPTITPPTSRNGQSGRSDGSMCGGLMPAEPGRSCPIVTTAPVRLFGLIMGGRTIG
jgi:N-sulfoglucosamine sulfohydrolase